MSDLARLDHDDTDLEIDATVPVPPSEADDSLSGLTIGARVGRYALQERLGAGAMGVVWAARDPRLDRRVAIKVVHPRFARDHDASKRLLREARAMAKVSHRSVVTVHDADEVDGRLYIAMELVVGTTLGQVLRSRSSEELEDWPRWLDTMLDAGRGLAAAHREGVLHRDFKPDNVLVDRAGRVCVADFGLASLGQQVLDTSAAPRLSMPLDLTQTGALLGTPAYMSPQQLRGEPVDERTDQFAFCIAAWEALYGRRPFRTDQSGLAALSGLVDSIERGVEPPMQDSPVPDAVRDALVRGLAADPARRWPSMDALVMALEEARPTQRGTVRADARPRRRRWPWLGVGLAVVVAGGFAWWLAVGRSHPRRAVVPTSLEAAAQKRFSVPLRTRIAIRGDGKRIVLGAARLEVRDLDGNGYWTAPLRESAELTSVAIDGDVVQFAFRTNRGIWTWHYETDAMPTAPSEPIDGHWYGRSALGDVLFVPGAVRVVDRGRVLQQWPVASEPESLRISPDGTRVAYFDGLRAQRLVVRDLTSGRADSIGPDVTFTTLAWRDDATLLYGSGIVDRPTIYEMTVSREGLGSPEARLVLDSGWIASVAATRDRLLFVEMGISSRTRVIQRSPLATRDFNSTEVAAPLAWVGNEAFLAWNRGSHRVERRAVVDAPGAGTLIGGTGIVLASEPANATVADGVLIASLRDNNGRRTIAYPLEGNKPLWQHDDLETFAVRCADDLHAPCFALRTGHDGHDVVRRIDPKTGALGEVVYQGTGIEDLTVDPQGTQIVMATMRDTQMIVLDLAHPGTSTLRELPMSGSRSVALDSGGNMFVTGTHGRNTYEAGALAPDGTYTVLAQTESDILSLTRPAPDGQHVLLLSRSFSPVLWEQRAAE